MALIKNIAEEIVEPLTKICNQAIEEGKLPKGMKIARVIPIYKKEDPIIFGN